MAGVSTGGVGASAVRAGAAYVEMWAKDQNVHRALDRLQARFKHLGSFMLKVGAASGIAGGLAMKPAVDSFVAFDDAIRGVKAVTQATGAEFDSLRAKALELGRTTSFSAAEVANLMLELGTAGMTASQVEVATAAVLDLARATQTDAATAAKVLGATLNGFGLAASDAASLADKFTVAANKSAVTVTDLGESFNYLAPVAADLGISVDTALALAGALGNVGIRGSEAGTALRRISVLIASGNADLTRIFGVSGQDAAGNVRPVVDVLDEIRASMVGLGNAQKSAKLNEFFGILGITGASAIGKSTVSIRDLETAIKGSAGAARRAAVEMDAGLGGGIRKLKSAVEGVLITFGDALAPALQFVGRVLELASGRAREFIAGNMELAGTIAGVAVAVIAGGLALAGLGVTVSAVATGVGVLLTGLGAVAGAIGALVSPVGLAAAAVVGLGVVFATQTDRGKAMVSSLGAGFEELNGTFTEAWGGIVEAVKKGDLELAFEVTGAGITVIWRQLLFRLRGMWNSFIGSIANLFKNNPALAPMLGLAAGTAVAGPVGGLVGLAGGVGVNFLDMERLLSADMSAAADGIKDAKAKLAALVERAKAETVASYGGGGDFDTAPVSPGSAPRPTIDVAAVKGAFSVPDASAQFGYMDSWKNDPAKQQVDLLAQIKNEVADLPADLAARLMQALKPR